MVLSGKTILSKLSDALVEEGIITSDQLAVARESQKNLGGSLEQILIDKGYVSEEKLLKSLAKRMNTSFISLAKYKVDPMAVKLLPVTLAKRHRAIPLFKVEQRVVIATSNPMNTIGMDDIRVAIGYDVEALLALDSDIERAIREHYRGVGITEEGTGPKVEIVVPEEDASTDLPAEHLKKAALGEDIVATVNNIIAQSFEDRASDIHIEPSRDQVKVRLRIDGVLEELSTLPRSMHLPIISRIKIIGGMDVAERRLPQDGRVRLRVSGEEIDLRIATYPTMFGEAAAIRLLSKRQLMTLEDLGFSAHDLEIFRDIITRPNGIFLVTGPTGSGKTTTLYAALMHINSVDKHILAIEDPVEHEIPGVDQQQVNVKAGMTFATSLRSMLRQDPDIIMLGEIRDFETADIAMRAAMTGHLVFSTLHTNSAVGAITRLHDLGIEPFLISSTMVGVMAQRLVRRICQKCKEEVKISEGDLLKLGKEVGITKAFSGAGCKYCRKTGYYGRIGLFEIVRIGEEIRRLIGKKVPEDDICASLSKVDHHSILDDGITKIKEGVTTVEEVVKVACET